MTEDAWELVAEAAGLPQAELFRSLLEAEEIAVLLSQEGVGHAMGLTFGTLGRVEVLVPARQAELAHKTLQAYFETAEDTLTGEEPPANQSESE